MTRIFFEIFWRMRPSFYKKGLKIILSVFWVLWGTKVLLSKVNNTKWNPKSVTLEFLINNLNVSRASADKKKYALHRFHCNGFPRYFFILSLIENKLFWMIQQQQQQQEQEMVFLWVDRRPWPEKINGISKERGNRWSEIVKASNPWGNLMAAAMIPNVEINELFDRLRWCSQYLLAVSWQGHFQFFK